MSEAPEPRPNLPEYSVSEISAALKRTVEDSFSFVRVRGEVSGVKIHSSGHTYFDLKDDKACLNAVVWRMTARTLRVKPQAGLEVICTGRISTYPVGSRYQIIVDAVELAGLGALMAMLEARRLKLAKEGLFDATHKKRLPFLPETIGVITSPTGAVIRDIMHRLEARFPRRVILWPVTVQGERAAAEISAAIRGFNALTPEGACRRPDLLIVARGGGSIEDLMPFNEEAVVRAVFESEIPVISGVGHETDTTLIDFAADVRAPTPSAAAEIAVPVRAELVAQVQDLDRRSIRAQLNAARRRRQTLAQLVRLLPREEQIFSTLRQRLDQAAANLAVSLSENVNRHRRRFLGSAARISPQPIRQHVAVCRERTNTNVRRLGRALGAKLTGLGQALGSLERVLESVSYRAVLERGFVLVRDEEGRVRREAAAIKAGEHLVLSFSDGNADVTAGKISVQPKRKPRPVSGSQGSLFELLLGPPAPAAPEKSVK